MSTLEQSRLANARESPFLPACRAFPAACDAEGLETRLNWATAAAGNLVGAVGWSQIVGLALCLALGARSGRRARPSPLRAVASPRAEAVARPWLGGPALSFPLAAFRLFLFGLLLLELFGLAAPEQNVLATPELLALVRARPPWSYERFDDVSRALTNRVLARFLPVGEGDSLNVDAWVRFLARVRCVVIGAWAAFLVEPVPLLYALGAVGYVYLGLVGLLYNPAHSTLAPMLFVLLAMVAVDGLAANDARAAAWLRRALLECVLAPAYLFSGVSKMRYMGLAFFGGTWLRNELHDTPRATLPGMVRLLRTTPGACEFMSAGNVMIEFALPILVVAAARAEGLWAQRLVRLFLFAAASFHVAIFFLMGPNFARMGLLLVLAAAPTCSAPDPGSPTAADARRGGVALVAMAGWFAAQFASLALHLSGLVEPTEKVDIRFPFSEMSTGSRVSVLKCGSRHCRGESTRQTTTDSFPSRETARTRRT